jgi:ribulose-5-phosphate 4-epimerase/fuculose-1-phosphate aldolase
MAEQEVLVKDLGTAEAMILRNHGLLTVGRSVGEAFNWMHRLEISCRAQLAAMACNTPFQEVSPEILQETYMNYQPQTRRPYGLMEWPALLRMVERMDPTFKE